MTPHEYIRQKIGTSEALAQLAEEAAELAKAAIKCRRAIDSKNPTPVTWAEAVMNLREEIADVDLCLVVLGDLCETTDMELKRMEEKQTRWIERLEETEAKE